MDESVFNPQSKLKRTGPLYGPLALVLIFLVVVLAMSLFFRVSEIEVVNASDYTDSEIITASGIEKGVNLFFDGISWLAQLLMVHIYCISGLVRISGFFTHIEDLSSVDLFQKSGAAQERRLAGAGRTDNADYFTAVYTKADILEDIQIIKMLSDMIHL